MHRPPAGPTLVDPSIPPGDAPAQPYTYTSTEVGGTGAPLAMNPVAGTLEGLRLTAPFDARYVHRDRLGHGGMGSVSLTTDSVIGRDVAMKVIRGELVHNAVVSARFVREARVQGQLEHPSIVPVYDLGLTPDGAAYFTMKRMRGFTLDAVIEGLASGDLQATSRFSRGRLLGALLSVCLAVDFAHKRGVLHRDLKPANIILGDFGEVSVLDWGLAKLVGVDDDDNATMPGGPISDSGERSQHTQSGTMLGTPGFMSPEQARGEIDRLDERADVYALGAILFEVLALQPLHKGDTVAEIIASTVNGTDARPSARGRANVPAQLEAICVKATAVHLGARYRTARDLADAIEAFLDAELAVEMRSKMADGHVAAARASLAAGDRIGALRELGRALALDPTHGGALRAMAEVIATEPRELPPEAERQLAHSADEARRASMRAIAKRYVLWTAFFPLAFWMGIRQWMPTMIAAAGAVLSGVLALWAARRPRVTRGHTLGVFAVTTFTMSSMSWLLGPFVLVPALVSTNTMLFAAQSDRRDRRFFTLVGMLAVIVPFAMEQLGIATPGYRFVHGIFEILPRATALPEVQTLVTLLIISLASMYIPARAIGRIRDALAAAERRVFVQAWQLQQLVPEATRDAVKR